MEAALFILAAFLSLIGVGYCIIRPKYAFVAMLLMFPVEQLLQSYNPELILRYNWLVNVLVGLVVLFAVVSSFFRKQDMSRGLWNGVTIPIYVLFMYVIAAMAWTPAPGDAQYFFKANSPYWIFFLVLSPLLLRKIDDFAQTIVATMMIGIVVSMMIFISPRGHFLYGRFVVDLGYLIGFGQLESNPLALADLGGTIAIMAILYHGNKPSMLINVIRVMALGAGLALALASGSRGQVVFSILCALAFLPLMHDRRNWGQLIALIISGLVVLVVLFIGYRLLLDPSGAARWKGQEIGEGLETRAQMAIGMMNAYVGDARAWIFGLGTSSFNYYYHLREQPHWFPHNIFVEALSEYGLFGMILLTVAVFSTWRWGRVIFQFNRDDIRLRAATLTFFAITVFQFLLALKQGHLLGPPLILTLMLCIGKMGKTEAWEQQQAEIWGGQPEDDGEWLQDAEYDPAYAPQAY